MKVFLLELSMVLAAFTLAAPLAAVAAAEDEDQTLAMHEGTDENQVNSLDFNDEYTRQLYQKVSLQNEKNFLNSAWVITLVHKILNVTDGGKNFLL